MAFSSKVLHVASESLHHRQTQRRDASLKLRDQTFLRDPRILDLDRDLRNSMLDVLSVALKSAPVSRLQDIKETNLRLQEELGQRLEALHVDTDLFYNKPHCQTCGDSGWIGMKMCDCLHALCAEKQLEILLSTTNVGRHHFDQFVLQYYPENSWAQQSLTPKQNMEVVFATCKAYSGDFEGFFAKNLLFSGSPGLGKSFLSACIARSVAEQGYSVCYEEIGNLLRQFQTTQFRSHDDAVNEIAKQSIQNYFSADLLIVDDLGTESINSMTQSYLIELISARLSTEKHTIISTNFSPGEMKELYLPQISSRLLGEYQMVHFFGEDIRQLKRNQR